MLVIGSHALDCHMPLGRVPRDFDVMGTPAELDMFLAYDKGNIISSLPQGDKKQIIRSKRFGWVEFELAWQGSTTQEFIALAHRAPMWFARHGLEFDVPGFDELYTLKMSHRFLRNNPHFQKTRRDLIMMEREFGAHVPSYLTDWLKRRAAETYAYGHPKLNQGKSGFFSGDGITYLYDHDTIHKSVAIGDVPMYTRYLKEGAEVAVDRNRWNALSEYERVCSVAEEAYVLAIERSQVPYPHIAPERSFLIALEKVCTSITSGWWRDYAYSHYDAALALFRETEIRRGSYAEKFWADVKSGLVQPFHKSEPERAEV